MHKYFPVLKKTFISVASFQIVCSVSLSGSFTQNALSEFMVRIGWGTGGIEITLNKREGGSFWGKTVYLPLRNKK